jgi:2-phospho-L-lactate guanylyltransferase
MTDGSRRERIVAVVPVRSLRNGKTRLATVLDEQGRETLLRQTAAGVVVAARHSGVVATVLVVSQDAEVLTWAATLGPDVIPVIQPADRPGLNGAIEAGREWALYDGATAILSLFADLPFLSPADIRGLIARPEPVVLGPDRRDEGTNALLLRLAGNGVAFRFAFGEDSLTRHLDEARRLGLDTGIYRAPGVAFDLDTPGDWTDYLATLPNLAAGVEPTLAPCGVGIA